MVWHIPEGGTQKGCAAAQLQHYLVIGLRREMASADGCRSVGDFCDLHRLNYGRMRKIFSGHQPLPFDELAIIATKLPRGVSLANALDTPLDMQQPNVTVLKEWPAPPATKATWDVARDVLATAIQELVSRVTDWNVQIKVIADPNASHADHPVYGWMDGRRAEVEIYLADDWLPRICDAGYSRYDGLPVLSASFVQDRPITFTVLDLISGNEEYEYLFVPVTVPNRYY